MLRYTQHLIYTYNFTVSTFTSSSDSFVANDVTIEIKSNAVTSTTKIVSA